MKKAKIILKNFVLIAVGIIGLVIFYNQADQTQMLIGIYALIIYLAYLANQRLDEFKKEKFYYCTFEKEVIAADSDKVVARFEVRYKLPFPPYIGLKVTGELNPISEDNYDYDNHDFEAFYTRKIISVIWRNSGFACEVEPHKMTSQNKLEEVIIGYCEYAWKLDGLYYTERKAALDYIEKELVELENIKSEISYRRHACLERIKKKLER